MPRRLEPLSAERPCIYCMGKRGDLRASDEHIWPASLGGPIPPSIFRTTQVCQTCNNICGLWVDGAFTKSWFVGMAIALASRDYIDRKKIGVLPLTYMGIDQEIAVDDDEACERWLGPCGETIYHLHGKDEPRWDSFAGGDIIRRRRDRGQVYVLLTSPSTFWSLTALHSIKTHFAKTPIRCLTTIVGLLPEFGILNGDGPGIGAKEASRIAYMRARTGMQQHPMSHQVDFADRFLAKVALGLGRTVLGQRVSQSTYADQLRELVWFNRPHGDYPAGIRGAGYWQNRFDLWSSEYLGWRGAWTITLHAHPDAFGMTVSGPDLKTMAMVTSDDPSLWSEGIGEEYGEGKVYVCLQQRAFWCGPIDLPDWIAHRLGYFRHPELSALEAMRIDPACLPDRRIPEEPDEADSDVQVSEIPNPSGS